jgi:hypothetical protein
MESCGRKLSPSGPTSPRASFKPSLNVSGSRARLFRKGSKRAVARAEHDWVTAERNWFAEEM